MAFLPLKTRSPKRITPEILQRLVNAVEAERAVGDQRLATGYELLLEWYAEAAGVTLPSVDWNAEGEDDTDEPGRS